MTPFYLALGIVLILLAVTDLLWTTLWVDGGAGPVTARLTTWAWRGWRRLGGGKSRALSLAGPVILVVILFTWVLLLWAGWTFVFAGGENSLIDTSNQSTVTWTGRIYFVAYSMFTMGNGDFRPSPGVWQIATALTTGSGMLFVTLAVSYVLSILGAVTVKRSFASGVTGLGTRSEDFVRSGWNGQDFHPLNLPLNTLSSQIATLGEQHKAYPILHYYHSEQVRSASAMAVAIFDEALTILRFGVPNAARPNAAVLESSRSSIEGYLQTLNGAFIKPAEKTPPPPDLAYLHEAGVPTVAPETFENALAGLEERRRKLLGMVQADAWYWPPLKE